MWIASFGGGGNNDARRLYAGDRRIPDASADSLPPASQAPYTRVLDDAWVRPHRIRDTRQKTSSRDLHNTGLYLKVAHATVLSRAYFTRELRLTRLQSLSPFRGFHREGDLFALRWRYTVS